MTTSREARPVRDVATDVSADPVVVVVGHEGDGLSEAALALCTHHARIPMTHNVDSLNVATAAAIAMYELTRT
jgi:tRNA G18 (ribose-2'-O)-methylase SpoU